MPRQSQSKAEVPDRGGPESGNPAQRRGTPGKAAKHEGPAGSGESRDLGNRKFNKESRDSVGEKEPGKSRRG